ncbi:MAG: hypothetical protein JWN73_1950 [Betaproteobacteria bacterium]|nr:hypothetical protein [Betaproteobacteria bacterium]
MRSTPIPVRLFLLAAALFAGAPALAGTILSSSSTPATAQLPASGGVTVQHNFDIKYFNNETFGCGARLSYSDGVPAETITIKKPLDKVSKSRQYSATGSYKATLEGFAFGGMVACLGSQTTSATVQGKVGGESLFQPAAPGAGSTLSLVKAKLTSLTLAQTSIPPSNSTTVVYTLAADKPIANCEMTYELLTNASGTDTINISLINPLDIGLMTLPVQAKSFSMGTLMNNGQYRTGSLRLFMRAKDTPTNTCTGAVHADFEIKVPASQIVQVMPMVTLDLTSITGVKLAPDWYDFLRKQYTVAILGKGSQKCSYQVEFKSGGFSYTSNANNSVLPMQLDMFSADLPAGNYTVTVKGAPADASNPQNVPCAGQASTSAKVSVPPMAMGISSTTMKVTKTNNAVLTQANVSLPLTELKAIALDVKFSNSINTDHNSPQSCAYQVTTAWPQGGSTVAYYIAQGAADNGVPVTDAGNNGIYNKGPGVYTITVEGTSSIPGNTSAIACVGSLQHKVTLTSTLDQVILQPDLQLINK